MKRGSEIPAHIRQLAEDASTAARGVLADWFEEHDDLATAERLREGGMAAQIALLSLFGGAPGERNDAVIINGRVAFEWCQVDLEMHIAREPEYDSDGSVRRFRRGVTTATAHVAGMPQMNLPSEQEFHEVTFLVRDTLVTVRPTEWTFRHDVVGRGIIHLDISGHVKSHELVDRDTGAMTRTAL